MQNIPLIQKKKRILFPVILFSLFVIASLFFTKYFSALSLSEEKNSISTFQSETQIYQKYNSKPQSPPVFKKKTRDLERKPIDTEAEIYDTVQHSLIEKESPTVSPPITKIPTKEQKEEIPLITTEENKQLVQPLPEKEPIEEMPKQDLTVTRVVDGDTLVLSDKKTVRLIGINTSEKDQPYYTEAKNALIEFVLGKSVRLEKDLSDTDKYGRLLRYVYVDDLFINLLMIKNGFANAYTYPPDILHKEEFLSAERTAREQGNGLWKKSNTPQTISLVELHADAQGSDAKNLNDEYVLLKNISNSPISLTHWSMKDAGTHVYTFSDFTLAGDSFLTLYSGRGTNTQNSLYWNSKDPIWNNDSDTLYLRIASGELAIEYAYSAP